MVVIRRQDRSIGRLIWKLEGSIPAANYILLPQDRDSTLGLTGRFLYLQVVLYRVKTLLALLASCCHDGVHQVV